MTSTNHHSGIKYFVNDPNLGSEEVLALYDEIGWNKANWRSLTMVKQALSGSHCYVTARNSGGELIGLVRAVSDGAIVCQIVDLMVKPKYRNQGVASNLLTRQINALERDFPSIMLIDGSGVPGFYKSRGFEPVDETVFYYQQKS